MRLIYSLAFAVVLFSGPSHAQSVAKPEGIGFKPGAVIRYNWSNGWALNDTMKYSYTPEGRVLSKTIKNGDGSWCCRWLYRYNVKGQVTEELSLYANAATNSWDSIQKVTTSYSSEFDPEDVSVYDWSGTTWTLSGASTRSDISYNSHNKVSEYASEYFNSFSGIWQRSYKQTNYLYDGNNNITQFDYQISDQSTTQWKDDQRVLINWDASQRPNEWILQTYANPGYMNMLRLSSLSWDRWCSAYTNASRTGGPKFWTQPSCAENRLNAYTSEVYGNSGWALQTRTSYTYDAYDGYVQLMENYDGTNWQNQSRNTIANDNHFNRITDRKESWDQNTGTWSISNEQKYLNTYDANGFLTEMIRQFAVTSPSLSFVNIYREVYLDPQAVVSVPEIPAEESGLTVFPNPASGSIRFAGKVLQTGTCELVLYNVTGEKVISANISNSQASMDISSLKKGVYFYLLNSAGQASAKGKIIIE